MKEGVIQKKNPKDERINLNAAKTLQIVFPRIIEKLGTLLIYQLV